MLTLKWNWGLAANSLWHLAKLAKLTTAVTAVKAGDNELLMESSIWAMLTLKWNWGLAANSLKHLAKLAKLATAVTAVKAGDSEFTFNDGIKYLRNVDVEMKLRYARREGWVLPHPIQCLNFAEKWFNSIFDSILLTQNSIQTIFRFKRNSGDSIQ